MNEGGNIINFVNLCNPGSAWYFHFTICSSTPLKQSTSFLRQPVVASPQQIAFNGRASHSLWVVNQKLRTGYRGEACSRRARDDL